MNLSNFKEELAKLSISVNEKQLRQLEDYYNILVDWNERMNLTGIVKKDDVYLKHFYDSLTLCKIIDLNTISTLCDIGTGAGFPGMVIKIVFPKLKVTLVDSLNKRINFLNYVIEKLELKDIETISARAEEYSVDNREIYDVVTARAVAPLSHLLEYSIPLVKVNGYFVAMKANADEEIANSQNAIIKLDCAMDSIIRFNLPFEESSRTLIRVKKISHTSKVFPRKYSEIKKRPL